MQADRTDNRVGDVGALRTVVAPLTEALGLSQTILLAVPTSGAWSAVTLRIQAGLIGPGAIGAADWSMGTWK